MSRPASIGPEATFICNHQSRPLFTYEELATNKSDIVKSYPFPVDDFDYMEDDHFKQEVHRFCIYRGEWVDVFEGFEADKHSATNWNLQWYNRPDSFFSGLSVQYREDEIGGLIAVVIGRWY